MFAALKTGCVVVLSTLLLSAAAAAGTVPEPSSYRLSDYRAPTPATVDGQKALTTAEAHDLWTNKKAVFVDVLPRPPKPADLVPGTVWRDKPRNDIPGSLWLPDTGYGAMPPETEAYFRRGLEQATGGQKDKEIVIYCLRDCWMSWNATKRAHSMGYTHAFWYSEGTDGWSAAGYPLEARDPVKRD
ncbi:MAG TPA: PQQ-dependent catabolism-associated CXXCW motif protein [Methylovirgula sp.]